MKLLDLFKSITWAKNGDLTDFTQTNYEAGWAYLGDDTPTVQDFNYVQQMNDKKDQWLFNQLKSVLEKAEIEPTEDNVNALRDAILKLAKSYSNPRSINTETINFIDAAGHTHEISKASLTEVGIVQLTNETNNNSENLALTAKAGKSLKDLIDAITRNLNNYIPNSKKSSSVTSNSNDTVATSAAAKTAYDKGVEALNKANDRVLKTGDTITGTLNVGQLNINGNYVNVVTHNNEFGGVSISRVGNTGNWLSRIEALPDRRWKFWVENHHENYFPPRGGTLALDEEVVNKNGDTVRWLRIEDKAAWLTVRSLGNAHSGIDFINHNGNHPQVSIHGVDAGGWADELRVYCTPPGNDYNSDRRQHVMTVGWGGHIWTSAYGWLQDKFVDKSHCRDAWYPNHYRGAQVFKLPTRADGSGLKVTVMQADVDGYTELFLPEAYDGFYIPVACDFGTGLKSLGVVGLSNNKIKVFIGGRAVIQIHIIGWSN